MPAAAAPPMQELRAPAAWQAVEFISDLHLQAGEPATFDRWRQYLHSTRADAVFILGDLFESWVGDDEARQPGFSSACADVLRESARQRPMFLMHGNRDFLVGSDLMDDCGVVLLADPTVLDFAGRRWLLTHGDSLCLADTAYLAFREQVRSANWQKRFLAQPLEERKRIARDLRDRSEARKRSGEAYADVDDAAARAWLQAAGAQAMIHGHTHRPADHPLGDGRVRIVLSDWDAGSQPPRLEVLRVDAGGWRRLPLA